MMASYKPTCGEGMDSSPGTVLMEMSRILSDKAKTLSSTSCVDMSSDEESAGMNIEVKLLC